MVIGDKSFPIYMVFFYTRQGLRRSIIHRVSHSTPSTCEGPKKTKKKQQQMAVDIENAASPQEESTAPKEGAERVPEQKSHGGQDVVPMEDEAVQDAVHINLTWRSWVWKC